MANSEGGSSSGAAQALEGEFHVFLSFRGSDRYHGFTDFLYHGLIDAGARVFKEEDIPQEGEVIGENILKAINNSINYIFIFSRSYVFSKWCLRELAHIVDNVSKSEGEKSIIPIFLDGESDDAKINTSQYTDAFLEHANEFPDEVKVWRKALAEVDEIKGWNVKKDQSQAAIIKLVIEKVLAKLETKQNSATEHLVGLEDRIKHLTELLNVNHRDVRFIGIYGMDGIGKTTVAKILFNQLSSNFGKYCSFIENIRERSSTKEGIVQLQKKLIYDIVGSGSVEQFMDIEQAMRTIGDSLGTKKVLMVLDDVDKKEHINYLIGGYSLYSGSRIIITNRNRIVLNVKGHRHQILWYEMPKMDDALALGLFCQHAFGRDFPMNEYHGLSRKIVSNLGGLPLAIQVTGSLLNGKDEAFWKETLLRLREVPAEEILETLRISYDSLDKYQQQIFLDIACFLCNENKTDAIYMWTDCQFYPIRGIKVLMDRCLIKITDNDKIWMHDQLIDLGRRIVRQENPFNPGKRSRLWIPKEALQIIGTKKRKDEVQAIKIFSSGDSINITNDDFERLLNLRFLDLNWGTYAGDFARCRSNLRWFSWHSPQDFRADNMCFDHLVVCKLDAIDFKDDSKAWDLIKGAQNLKALSLTRCTGITTIPDFSKCSCLERLTLLDCFNLKRIESFIGDLRSLIELKIEECRGLTDLPEEVGALVKLKHFSMSGCSGLRELPGTLGNLTSLTELDLSDTIIRELPNCIGMLSSLRILRLPIGELIDRERHVWQLPSGISTLVTLEELDLCRRNEMTGEIPVGIGELSSLKILNLEHTSICRIPRTIYMLHHLQTLNLRSCHEIQTLPELPTSLTCLLLESKSLLSVPNLSNQTNLVELQLSDGSRDNKKSNLITGSTLRWIGRLSRLKKLELELLNVPAPPELASLSHLEELVLRHLDLEPLVQLPSSDWSLRSLSTLKLYRCEVEDIPLVGLPLLEKLTVEGCKRLQRLSIPLELRKLLEMLVLECPELVEIQVMGLLKSLEYLRVFHCESLISISGLSHFKNLESLALEQCNVLTEVEGLDELESMKHLQVQECTSLRRLIDVSCTKIADDCRVTIKRCGDSIKDSEWEMPLQRYREEILLITSNKENPRVPAFLKREGGNHIPYTTVYFDKARKGRGGTKMINPNDPEKNPALLSDAGAPPEAPASRAEAESEDHKREGVVSSVRERKMSDDDGSLARVSDHSIDTNNLGSSHSKGDDFVDSGAVTPKFDKWDENDPASADCYTHVFNKVQEERQGEAQMARDMFTRSPYPIAARQTAGNNSKRETEGGKKATAWWEKVKFWRTSIESGNNEIEKEKGKEKTEDGQTAAGKTEGGQTAAGTSEESCTKEKEEVEVKEKTRGGERTITWKTSKELPDEGKREIVLKLDLHREKDKKRALKMVSEFAGVESMTLDMEDMKMTVIGAIDDVKLVHKLRKRFGSVICSIGPIKETWKKNDNEKDNQDEGGDSPPYVIDEGADPYVIDEGGDSPYVIDGSEVLDAR